MQAVKVAGASMMAGYLGQQPSTPDDWFATGDPRLSWPGGVWSREGSHLHRGTCS